ncbi:MAG: flagellar basal body protein [Pseudomonadota bacterium]
MHDLQRAMLSASSGMSAQSFRMRLIGENVANSDTPGFQRKTITFEQFFDRSNGAMTLRLGPVRLSQTDPREAYEPGNPLADDRGVVTYSNVDPLIEIADAREAQRSYQANLTVFDQARRMHGGLLDLLQR